MDQPGHENDFQREHADLLRWSYKRWTGRDLVPATLDSRQGAGRLYDAAFVVLSHNTAPDPVLNYANLRGLNLFALTWQELTHMPSRLTAETVERSERARLMQAVSEKGYIDDYSGIRISKTGRRFHISRATVWNLVDSSGTYRGQAARFSNWTAL